MLVQRPEWKTQSRRHSSKKRESAKGIITKNLNRSLLNAISMELNELKEQIRKNTADMRSSKDPLWKRFRKLLSNKNIDFKISILAEVHTEDNSLWEGIIVTDKNDIFHFDFDYLHKPVTKAEFTRWEKLNEAEDYYLSEYILCALKM